jgi:hypothetical protein
MEKLNKCQKNGFIPYVFPNTAAVSCYYKINSLNLKFIFIFAGLKFIGVWCFEAAQTPCRLHKLIARKKLEG